VWEVVEGGDGGFQGREQGVELDKAVGEEGVAGERRLDEERVHGAAEAEHVAGGDGALEEGDHLRDRDAGSRGGCRRRGAWRRVDGGRSREKAAHAFPGEQSIFFFRSRRTEHQRTASRAMEPEATHWAVEDIGPHIWPTKTDPHLRRKTYLHRRSALAVGRLVGTETEIGA
jgi:hypothetical protein